MTRRLVRAHLLALVFVLGLAACGGSDAKSTDRTTSTAAKGRPKPPPLAGRPAGGAKVGQHWHAAFGVDACGKWLTAPMFEARSGIHSHGDGMIHIHPFTASAAGKHATVRTFLAGGGWTVTKTSIDLGSGARYSNGDACPDGKPGAVRWSVNGQEQRGNLADFVPFNGDVIALAFLPAGQPIPTPPQAAALDNIGDVG